MGVRDKKRRETYHENQKIFGKKAMKCIELFAGAGGLALGTMSAGFRHEAVIELDNNACGTMQENKRRGVIAWPMHQTDVREFDFTPYRELDLLAGGPPCQPFSIGGKHRGHADHRNLFPEMVRAIHETRPQAILIENVKGLLRTSFAKYFEYILLRITYPTISQRKSEEWTDHLSRLERHHTKSKHKGFCYHVVFRRLNAADYGVPQRRERVFIVGFRNDLDANWAFPEPTHSQDALLFSMWGTGEYWDRHGIAKQNRPEPPFQQIKKYRDFEKDFFNRICCHGLPCATRLPTCLLLPIPIMAS